MGGPCMLSALLAHMLVGTLPLCAKPFPNPCPISIVLLARACQPCWSLRSCHVPQLHPMAWSPQVVPCLWHYAYVCTSKVHHHTFGILVATNVLSPSLERVTPSPPHKKVFVSISHLAKKKHHKCYSIMIFFLINENLEKYSFTWKLLLKASFKKKKNLNLMKSYILNFHQVEPPKRGLVCANLHVATPQITTKPLPSTHSNHPHALTCYSTSKAFSLVTLLAPNAISNHGCMVPPHEALVPHQHG